MRTRSSLLALLFGCLASFSVAACTTVGDGDGTDSSDSDFSFCRPTQIDSNADGVADGLDINCDGVIDFAYGDSGSSGGGGSVQNKCSTMATINGETKAITCTNDGGATTTCECRVNGTLQSTCTQSSASCTIGVPNGNCCGF